MPTPLARINQYFNGQELLTESSRYVSGSNLHFTPVGTSVGFALVFLVIAATSSRFKIGLL